MRITTPLEGGTITRIFQDCIIRSGEDKSRGVSVASIITHGSFRYFDKERLEVHRAAIGNMLKQLPKEFTRPEGANFSSTKDDHRGIEWNRLELVQEQLIQLGVAIGEAEVSDVRNWCHSHEPNARPTVKVKP